MNNRSRKSRRYIPPSYTWIKGVAIFWLVVGVACLIMGATWLWPRVPDYRYDAESRITSGVIVLIPGIAYTIIPIGVLLRTRWGYVGGMVLCAVMLLGFPFGTILGVVTMKAYRDGRTAFGV